MSQFGQQQFLYDNKPVNTINVSGIQPGQAVGELQQTKQGELNRAHDSAMQSQQIAAQQQIAAGNQALQSKELDLAVSTQQWKEQQAEWEKSRMLRMEANKGKASKAVLDWMNARRTGDTTSAQVLDSQIQDLQRQMSLDDSAMSDASKVATLFSQDMDTNTVKEALTAYYDQMMTPRYQTSKATIGRVALGVMQALNEIGAQKSPAQSYGKEPSTVDTIKDTVGYGVETAARFVKNRLTSGKLTDNGTGMAKAISETGLAHSGQGAPDAAETYAKRVAQSVSDDPETSARLTNVLRAVIQASTNPVGADDSHYFQVIKDGVNQLVAPGADGKQKMTRSDIDLIVNSMSKYAKSGATAFSSSLVGEELGTLEQDIQGAEAQHLPQDLVQGFASEILDFKNGVGQSWGSYLAAMGDQGSQFDPIANIAPRAAKENLTSAVYKILSHPETTQQDYVKAFNGLPTDMAGKLANWLIEREDNAFMQHLQDNPQLAAQLAPFLHTAMDSAGSADILGALGQVQRQGDAAHRQKEDRVGRLRLQEDAILKRASDRNQYADPAMEAVFNLLQSGASDADVSAWLGNYQ